MIITNPRDPLTQRYARSLRETVRDPYAYSEGTAEPQWLDVARSFPHAARVRRAAARWRSSGRMPPGDDFTPTMPAVPFPAEACTELGARDDDAWEPDDYPKLSPLDFHAEQQQERRLMQMLVGIIVAAVLITAGAWLWRLTIVSGQ
jgi:hypothetical protein